MENKQLIEKYIGDITSCVQLNGTTDALIYLVNDKYIVKTHITDGETVGAWYEHNHRFAPQVLYKSKELLIYTFVHNHGALTETHIVSLFQLYSPLQVGLCQDSYYELLELEYLETCNTFDLKTIKLTRPIAEKSYNLHGDMGFHNLVITESSIKLIDPEPLVGSITLDLLQFYMSDPRVMNLISIDKLSRHFSIECFSYYYPIVLVDRIIRSSYHHPQDLEFYKKVYQNYISTR